MIAITSRPNGVFFDMSNVQNRDFNASDKFIFFPRQNNLIKKVGVKNIFVYYECMNGDIYKSSLTNPEHCDFPVATIEGVAPIDNYDLFDKFISII